MLSDALASFANQRIMVVGDLILDEYIFGDVERISPEAPIPIVTTRSREYHAGGASNVAANIAAFGGMPLLCGVVGCDEYADTLAGILQETLTTNTSNLIPVNDRPTTLKSRIIAQSQQMLRLDTERTAKISSETEDAILSWSEQYMPEAHACILSDYAKGVLTDRVCQGIIALGNRHGLPVIIDPKGRRYKKYAGATVITPNRHEAAIAANHTISNQEDLNRVAKTLIDILGNTNVLITRGEDGMSLFRPHGVEPFHLPAYSRTVYDVTGAGDTVVSTLALALATGLSLESAMALSNAAASIVIGKLGTTPVTREELEEAIAKIQPFEAQPASC